MQPPRVVPFELIPLLQQAREPMFWFDGQLKLAWANRAWELLTGSPAESVVGLTCQAHAPTRANDPADLVSSFYPPPESLGGRPAGTSALIFHAGGERLWRRIEFWPFCDQRGTLIGLLGQVREEDGQPSVPDTVANRLHAELLAIRRELYKDHGFDALVGSGPFHRRLLDQVRLAASSTIPVLIVGEPGTGKRHAARIIHQQGPNCQRPLVPFDCEALPAQILERELFGGDRQQDPGGRGDSRSGGARRPRLALADGATVLIREILTLPRDLQARLVAALDAHVRLLATTVHDPEIALESEQLRPELYFALTGLVIRLRPLRERRAELPLLAQHLLERANQRGGEQRTGFSPEAVQTLMAYDWPGNLRELARVIDHAHACPGSQGSLIEPSDLPASIRGNLGAGFAPPSPSSPIEPLDEILTQVERRLIETALRQARRNKSRAADLLGISRPRLYRRIKELSLPDEPEPADEPDNPPLAS
jgi:DNA-binding NtrC family response regulator